MYSTERIPHSGPPDIAEFHFSRNSTTHARRGIYAIMLDAPPKIVTYSAPKGSQKYILPTSHHCSNEDLKWTILRYSAATEIYYFCHGTREGN